MQQEQAIRGGDSFWWFFQRISGVALIVLLLMHFLVMHFVGELNFADVSARVNMPLWKVIDLCFLVLALWHGLYGLWLITGDYLELAWLRMLVFFGLSLGGIGLLVMGIVTLLPKL